MGNFIARDVQLHQIGHFPDLLRQGDELVVVGHEALQIDETADGSRKIGQLITAYVEVHEGVEADDVVRNALDGVVIEEESLQTMIESALGRNLDQSVAG